MNIESRRKVIGAGFTILRPDDRPFFRIKCLRSGSRQWETWMNYESALERDNELKRLLKLSTFIED
jgi:hypothetical protein